jgi:hypothetical protein
MRKEVISYQTLNRHGAEEARRAHNPEDVGSKPTAGTLVSIQVHSLVEADGKCVAHPSTDEKRW